MSNTTDKKSKLQYLNTVLLSARAKAKADGKVRTFDEKIMAKLAQIEKVLGVKLITADAEKPYFYKSWEHYKTKNGRNVELADGRSMPQWQIEEKNRLAMDGGQMPPLSDLSGGREFGTFGGGGTTTAMAILGSRLGLIDETVKARQMLIDKFGGRWPKMEELEKVLLQPLRQNKEMFYNEFTSPSARGGMISAKAGAGKTTAFTDYYPVLVAARALTAKDLWWTAPQGTIFTISNFENSSIGRLKEQRFIVGAPTSISGTGEESGAGDEEQMWNAFKALTEHNSGVVNYVFDEFYSLLKSGGSGGDERGPGKLVSILKDSFGKTGDPKRNFRFFGLYATNDWEDADRLFARYGLTEGQMARRLPPHAMSEIGWEDAEKWALQNLIGRSFMSYKAPKMSDLDNKAQTEYGIAKPKMAKLLADKAKKLFYRTDIDNPIINPQQTSVQAALVILFTVATETWKERMEEPIYRKFKENDDEVEENEDFIDNFHRQIAKLDIEIEQIQRDISGGGGKKPKPGGSKPPTRPDLLAAISFREVTAVDRSLTPAAIPPLSAVQPQPTSQPVTAPAAAVAPVPGGDGAVAVEQQVDQERLQQKIALRERLLKKIQELVGEIDNASIENVKIKKQLVGKILNPKTDKDGFSSEGDYVSPDLSDYGVLKRYDIVMASEDKCKSYQAAMQGTGKKRKMEDVVKMQKSEEGQET